MSAVTSIIPTVKLHLNKREVTFLVPLYITLMVAAVSVLVSIIAWRAGSQPGSDGWVTGSRNNPGIAYSLPGFLVYLGVQSIGTTFPFALTLGATRRAFTVGTLTWAAMVSAYLALVIAALTLLEIATGHWFAGFYLFDIYILGTGNIPTLLLIVFLGSLTSLTLGGVFGASWVRFGNNGPRTLGIAMGLVIAIGAILIVPAWADLAAAFELWWLALVAVVIIAASSIASWAFLRSATVR
jgi:hypothetical protein